VTATAAAHVDIDEYRQTGLRIETDGRVQYFRVGDNESLGEARLPLPEGVTVSTVTRGSITSGLVASACPTDACWWCSPITTYASTMTAAAMSRPACATPTVRHRWRRRHRCTGRRLRFPW